MHALVKMTFVTLCLVLVATPAHAADVVTFDDDTPVFRAARCVGDLADSKETAEEAMTHRETIQRTVELLSCFSRCVNENPQWPSNPLPVVLAIGDCYDELMTDVEDIIKVDLFPETTPTTEAATLG